MQFRKLAVAIGICALSSPVWAQSVGIGGTATGVNETAGNSSAGVKAQGSGSADINSNRPSSPNRATGTDRADQRRTDRATGTTGTTTGNAVGGTAGAGAGVNTGAGGLGVGVGAGAAAGTSPGGSTGGNPGNASGTQ